MARLPGNGRGGFQHVIEIRVLLRWQRNAYPATFGVPLDRRVMGCSLADTRDIVVGADDEQYRPSNCWLHHEWTCRDCTAEYQCDDRCHHQRGSHRCHRSRVIPSLLLELADNGWS
jgi:hypothetical protein